MVKKRLIIIDGSSLMFRAFFALPLLSNSSGEFTNALYGFSNMLIKLIRDWKPDCLTVAFDKSRHTFRTELYSGYKGNRSDTPNELLSQIPMIKSMLSAWGINILELENFEADDIIGTLAKQAEDIGEYEIFIVTGDRDALQLIDDNVKVIFTQKGISEVVVYDKNKFLDEYGFSPIKLIDFKGLMGDHSDNIPGVPGVGPKTAKKLLLMFDSLENVFCNIDNIAGKKLKENLLNGKDLAFLSKELATINRHLPIDIRNYTLTIKPDINALEEFCQRYNLKSLQKNISGLYVNDLFTQEGTVIEYNVVYTLQELERFFEILKDAAQIAFFVDFEGRSPFIKFKQLGAVIDGSAFYIERYDYFQRIFNFIKDNKKNCFLYDAKNYYHLTDGFDVAFFDVKLAEYLVASEENNKTIEVLAEKYGNKYKVFNNSGDSKAYCCWEAAVVYESGEALFSLLETQSMISLYEDIEAPLVPVLAEMERIGIYLNRQCLESQNKIVTDRIIALQDEIYDLAKEKFNINSPKQLGYILFDKLDLAPVKKTKKGYSTNADVLKELRTAHPIIEKILSYRLWSKIKSTYLDALAEMIDNRTERIHTTFNQMSTATGRLSSSEPNLQNIPVRKEEGRAVRAAFEPGNGFDYFLSADYSQIELRILAHLSQDNNFLTAYRNNEDIHTRTAAQIFGIESDEVSSELRSRAKAVNFGIVYGISDYGLSKDIGISKKQAGEYIESYFRNCSGVKKYLDLTIKGARENGYVSTIFNRRRLLMAINSQNFVQRALAERMAMNTPIQGTAADIIKLAMIAVYKKLKELKLRSRIVLQVHDELLLEVPASEMEQVSGIVKNIMENIVELSVPLIVDINYGQNWAEVK